MRFFTLFTILIYIYLTNIVADNTLDTQKREITAKLLYQSYYNLPKKLFEGEVFPLTIKSLCARKDYQSIKYSFSNSIGLKLLSAKKQHRREDPYFYDTFYFQVIGEQVRTPDIKTSLIFEYFDSGLMENLAGVDIETVKLNPKKDFSKILAEYFNILKYKTTQYDNNSNIVVFSAEGKMANIHDFSLSVAKKEGIDSYKEDFPYSKFTYYAVIPKQLSELKFTYFNLKNRRFEDIVIPVIVQNDSVSTQTDLAPTQNTHNIPKIIISAILSIIALLLFIYKDKKFYLVLFILPLIFIAKLLIPIKHVCIKEDSNIYLLPIKNGTVFEQIPYRFTTEDLGESQNFTKIRMQNNQIGWVKNENLCED